MDRDDLGFRYPRIDMDLCIGCGSCDCTCPVVSPRSDDATLAVKWGWANDADLVASSSSGGVFGLLARKVLDQGGVVYGAAFDAGCKAVRHVAARTDHELIPLLRSKYVQSAIDAEVYSGIASDLRAGSVVLFCGTACQTAGVAGYLAAWRVPTANLLLVDVVCHGVPSPLLWQRWLEDVSGGHPVESVNFRCKTPSWQSYSLSYSYRINDGEIACTEHPSHDDWYMRAFLSNASLRGSCLNCPAKRRCGSDITLGDYWGFAAAHPEVPFADKGISAFIVHSDAGIRAIEQLDGVLESGVSTLERVVSGNPSLVKSPAPYPEREAFLSAVERGVSIHALMERWPFKPSRVLVLKARIKRVVKKMARCIRRTDKGR